MSKARSFKHSKTINSFLYSIYHQRTGKTSLFHMRGVDFTHFKTGCTFVPTRETLPYIMYPVIHVFRISITKVYGATSSSTATPTPSGIARTSVLWLLRGCCSNRGHSVLVRDRWSQLKSCPVLMNGELKYAVSTSMPKL